MTAYPYATRIAIFSQIEETFFLNFPFFFTTRKEGGRHEGGFCGIITKKVYTQEKLFQSEGYPAWYAIFNRVDANLTNVKTSLQNEL